MLLASSRPHDDFSINGLIDRIKLRPMNFLCHRGVPTEAAMDVCVVVRFGQILRVEGYIRRRLPFVGHTVCLDLSVRHTTMCHRLRKKEDD